MTQRDRPQCAFGAQFVILRKLRRMTAKPSLICDCFILWVPEKEGRIFSVTLVYHCHITRLHILEANKLEPYSKVLECGNEFFWSLWRPDWSLYEWGIWLSLNIFLCISCRAALRTIQVS